MCLAPFHRSPHTIGQRRVPVTQLRGLYEYDNVGGSYEYEADRR